MKLECFEFAAHIPNGLQPPEVLEQGTEEAWSPAGDVWCYGMLIWKLFSGNLFLLKSNVQFDYAFCQGLHEGIISPLAKPIICPKPVWQLAQKCLTQNRKDRPSMQEVRKELDSVMQQLRQRQAKMTGREEVVTAAQHPEAKRLKQENPQITGKPEALYERALRISKHDEAQAALLFNAASKLGHAPSKSVLFGMML